MVVPSQEYQSAERPLTQIAPSPKHGVFDNPGCKGKYQTPN
jgi:hypothetical protein